MAKSVLTKPKDKKIYTFGADKIKAETETEGKSAKGKKNASKGGMSGETEVIIEYISEKCTADADYNALVLQPHKSWKRCYDFIFDKARKKAAGKNSCYVSDRTVFGWIDEYFKKDDKAEVEAEKKKEAEAKEKKLKEKADLKKRKEEAEKKKTLEKVKENIEENFEKIKEKGKRTEKQLSLFDMQG